MSTPEKYNHSLSKPEKAAYMREWKRKRKLYVPQEYQRLSRGWPELQALGLEERSV